MKGFVLAVLMAALPGAGEAACRLALAFALDVSGSVDDREYRLQMDGLAAALEDPDVVAALLGGGETPVALAAYEWSSSAYQRLILDWVLIEDAAVLDGVRARLRAWPRKQAPESTGLGAALEYGKTLLDRAPACWNQTLDVSGDGKNNDWPNPRRSRAEGKLAGVRINALVVGRDTGTAGEGGQPLVGVAELAAYFRANIIQGPDAFVEVALGFEEYARAMRRKLLREIATRPVGQSTPPSTDRRQALSDQ